MNRGTPEAEVAVPAWVRPLCLRCQYHVAAPIKIPAAMTTPTAMPALAPTERSFETFASLRSMEEMSLPVGMTVVMAHTGEPSDWEQARVLGQQPPPRLLAQVICPWVQPDGTGVSKGGVEGAMVLRHRKEVPQVWPWRQQAPPKSRGQP